MSRQTNRLREYVNKLPNEEALSGEKIYLQILLEEYSNNYFQAAAAIGMAYNGFNRLTQLHGLSIPKGERLAELNRERARQRNLRQRATSQEIAKAKEELYRNGLGYLLLEEE